MSPILFYNQFDYTNACIRSIIEHTDFEKTPYEIVIADDCSSDETQQIEEFFPNIVRVKPEHNLGFLENCNNAIKHVRGKYIFLLNNDTQIQVRALQYIMDAFDVYEDAAIIGSKLVYPDGTLQEAGGIVWHDASAANYGINDNAEKPEYRYLKETDYISGAAIMIKKSFWDEVGGFDTRYIPAYYEDTDLCMQARDKGYKVILQPASIVVHFEGKSHGTDTSSGIKRYQDVNAEKFRDKWINTLSKHHTDNANVLRARERSTEKKVAYVMDYFLPDYDRHCGARHTYQYVKLLKRMGYMVKYVAEACSEERQELFAKELEQLGIETFYPRGVFHTHHWSGLLESRADAIDLVVLNRPHIASEYLPTIKKLGLKTLMFNHDVHSLRNMRLAEQNNDEAAMGEAKREEKYERDLYAQVDHVVTPSSFEAEYVKKNWGIDHITNIPLYIEAPTDFSGKSNIKKGNDILFVGGMVHIPNAHGITWFTHKVLPLISESVKDIKVHIVGTGCPSEVRDLDNPNIIIHGGISDGELFDLYSKCKASIIPLHSGAGVKGKIIESLFYGVPVVSTTVGLEGIDGLDEFVKASDTAGDFANETIRILKEDPGALKETQDKISHLLENSFSVKKGREILDKILNDIG